MSEADGTSEEDQAAGGEVDSARSKGPKKGKKPRRFGGRRTGVTPSAPVKRASFNPGPELICRKAPGSVRWEIALSVDDSATSVKQDGEPLSPRNGSWPLARFAGHLSVELKEGPAVTVPLFDQSPLIFKLKKDWGGDGRRVPRVTRGHFIVIAPVEWERLGHVPVEPEACSDPAFMAHFFFRDGTESASDVGGFREHDVPSSAPDFKLIGRTVFDDSDEGDLFVGKPPQLIHADRVVWARVGEERENGWKGCNFQPSECCLAKVMDARQGRFFLRVYDKQVAMLDGAQFRYLRDLREIQVNGEPYSEDTLLVPGAAGYAPTSVRFIGVDGSPIQASPLPGTATSADKKGGLIAAPSPEADAVSCTLTSNGGSVDIALRLPRIWWRMERNGDESDNEYRSMPFEMTRGVFREEASDGALVRVRIPIRLRSVRVGFDTEYDRVYQVTKRGAGYEVEFPLEHFEDYTQMERRFEDSSLNIRCADKSWSLVQLRADPEISVSLRPATGNPKAPEECPRDTPSIDEFRNTFDASCNPPWYWHPAIIDEVVQRLLRTLPGLSKAVAYYEFPVQVRHHGRPWLEAKCHGASTDWAAFSPGNMLAGEGFAPADVRDAQAVVVLSSSLAEEWFGEPVAALGRHLNARVQRGATSERLEIVGVFEPQGDVADRASSCFIVAPASTAAKRLKDRTYRITTGVCAPNDYRSGDEIEAQVRAALSEHCQLQQSAQPSNRVRV